MFIYFVILNLVLFLVLSSAAEEIQSGIKDQPSENKNRIKGKHMEMWDIILSILERKETLESILKTHSDLSNGRHKNNSKMSPRCGQYYVGDTSNNEKLDENKLNYLEQYYNFNVDISTLILKELCKLAELERECQALI